MKYVQSLKYVGVRSLGPHILKLRNFSIATFVDFCTRFPRFHLHQRRNLYTERMATVRNNLYVLFFSLT